MGKRENKVEGYLEEQIKLHHNGVTRKWKSVNMVGVMDRIVFIDPEWFVEVKTSDGTQSSMQHREATRLIRYGARCAAVYGHSGVDQFVEWLKDNKNMKPKVQLIFK